MGQRGLQAVRSAAPEHAQHLDQTINTTQQPAPGAPLATHSLHQGAEGRAGGWQRLSFAEERVGWGGGEQVAEGGARLPSPRSTTARSAPSRVAAPLVLCSSAGGCPAGGQHEAARGQVAPLPFPSYPPHTLPPSLWVGWGLPPSTREDVSNDGLRFIVPPPGGQPFPASTLLWMAGRCDEYALCAYTAPGDRHWQPIDQNKPASVPLIRISIALL